MSDYPVLSQHFGAWEGTYTLKDSRTGQVLDRHRSRIEVWRDGQRYFQRNIDTWPDGRQTSVEFPGDLRDGRIYYDNDRLSGEAVEAWDHSVLLTWRYKHAPEERMLEPVQLVSPTRRVRTWQYPDGRVMHIEEDKVA